jgi:hypothetical protein
LEQRRVEGKPVDLSGTGLELPIALEDVTDNPKGILSLFSEKKVEDKLERDAYLWIFYGGSDD